MTILKKKRSSDKKEKINCFLIFGPPLSGKSTLTNFLLKKWKIKLFIASNLLRNYFLSLEEKVAAALKKEIAQGKLLNDKIVNDAVLSKLEEENKNFLLDGYPRTFGQLEALENFFLEKKFTIKLIINLKISSKIIFLRAQKRFVCQYCFKPYSFKNESKELPFCPKRKKQKCILIKRPEDKENILKERLFLFERDTVPVIKAMALKYKKVFFSLPAEEKTISLWEKIEAFLKKMKYKH